MRKLAQVTAMVGGFLLVGASAAMAQGDYPPSTPPTGTPPGGVQAGNGEVAFTGSDVTLLMVLVAVLVVAGVAALALARRRTAVPSA